MGFDWWRRKGRVILQCRGQNGGWRVINELKRSVPLQSMYVINKVLDHRLIICTNIFFIYNMVDTTFSVMKQAVLRIHAIPTDKITWGNIGAARKLISRCHAP